MCCNLQQIVFLVNPSGRYCATPFWMAVNALSMVRLVRLGHILPDVPELLLVLVKSSQVVFPLILILVIVTFLWSVCGVIAFGNETYFADLFGHGYFWEPVNRHQGFHSVAQGMQTMLGIATSPGSDGWINLMQSYADATSEEWNWAVLLFFSSYALLTRFLLVNFFMMTLLFKYKTHSKDKVNLMTFSFMYILVMSAINSVKLGGNGSLIFGHDESLLDA